MNDSMGQYKEHIGNVHNGVILPHDIKLSHIPDASKLMNVSSYLRESREHLASPMANLQILGRATSNSSKMSSRMLNMVKKASELLNSRLNEKL